MSWLPVHVADQTSKTRPSGGNTETRSDVVLKYQHSIPQTLPPQYGGSQSEQPRIRYPYVRAGVDTNMPQWDHTDFSMSELEHALAAMLRDADNFEAREKRQHHVRRDSGFMMSAPVEQPSPPKKSSTKGAVARAAKPRLQSLAATHPSQYSQPPAQATASTSLQPQSDKAQSDKASTEPLGEARPNSSSSILPWQIHSDPKELNPPSLANHGQTVGMRNADIKTPNVVSPVRMTTLPFGTMIEVAHDYDAKNDEDSTKK
ncbi:uncharacterized protein RCC_00048 [Ramularia collo-cygni]|uniref:Uncharacterized protein n=1 Tax=Ramularia collo-cygni TaxID=112498 RepID=A0A2D3V1G0_9PEZI|nr:uncharacterized protein RCC_00048 [Ramularia collo-cygni]CZT14073.1 uncharacterized protein RCC_00048 [Ramularia collo-cygni]